MTVQVKPGARFRSAVCDCEVIVVKAPAGDLDLRCGGQEMLTPDATKPEGGSPGAGFDKGTLLGKRYTDAGATIEVLCTKPGPSSLSVGEELLEVKDAKPLPSSD